MADAGPPVIPIIPRAAYLTNILVGTSVFLLFLAALTLAMRVYTKTRIAKDVGWDDFFIILGFVSWPITDAPPPKTSASLTACRCPRSQTGPFG